MGYLRKYDYNTIIQPLYFSQLTQANDANRIQTENTALTEMISYLAVKYDTTAEFQNTNVFSFTQKYLANNLVELNFPTWTAGTYPINALVTYNGVEYYSTAGSNATTPGAPLATWQAIGNQYDLYYLAYPYAQFNIANQYAVGNIVYYNGSVYKCLVPTTEVGHFAKLQGGYTNQSTPNVINFFPGDGSYNSIAQWGTGTPYSVTGIYPNGVLPSNWTAGTYTQGQTALYNGIIWQVIVASTTATPGADIINWQPITWTFGDNRNSQLVRYLCYMVVWYLSDTLAPRNKPEYWKDNYETAVNWLIMASRDDKIKPAIPELQPPQGSHIRWGSQAKQRNNYT
jgi:hypothetical protein